MQKPISKKRPAKGKLTAFKIKTKRNARIFSRRFRARFPKTHGVIHSILANETVRAIQETSKKTGIAGAVRDRIVSQKKEERLHTLAIQIFNADGSKIGASLTVDLYNSRPLLFNRFYLDSNGVYRNRRSHKPVVVMPRSFTSELLAFCRGKREIVRSISKTVLTRPDVHYEYLGKKGEAPYLISGKELIHYMDLAVEIRKR